MKYEIRLPGAPPSLNRVGSRGSRFAWTREKKKWQSFCFIALLEAKVPKNLGSVRATAIIYPKTNARRDEGNYRTLLEKSLGDALQLGGWIEDDTPEFFRFGELSFAEKRKPPETVVTIEVRDDDATA